MTDVRTLETVIADWRSDANALDRQRKFHEAEDLRHKADQVEKAAENFITFLTEKEAMLWSGHSKEWLRQRFSGWERDGNARYREHGKKERLYRRCVLPRRANLGAARADAIRTARQRTA